MIIVHVKASNMEELLYNGNCQTCHFTNKSISAPSIKFIKRVYKNAFILEKDFVSYMTNFVISPNKNISLMHDMITKYEIMLEIVFEQEVIEDISRYIYRNEF